MKRIFNVIAATAMTAIFSVACTENPAQPEKINAKVQEVSGIEEVYALDKNEVLEITPEIKFTDGEVGEVTYEWTIGDNSVSTEKKLSYTCNEDGEFEAAFKVSIDGKEPFVKTFKVIVAPQLAMVKEITGIEAVYEVAAGENLTISPEITYTEGEVGTLTYEWKLGEKVISNEASLNYTCANSGEFNASFKVMLDAQEPVVKTFTVTVKASVPVSFDNRGLLLLTDDENGSMLTYKRLDEMDVPVYKDVFKSVNADYELGKSALDIAWFGTYVTDYGFRMDRSTDLDVLISSNNPNKIYSLDPATLKVKQEFSCPIAAEKIFILSCFQQELYDDLRAYFIGNEMVKMLKTTNLVVNSDLPTRYKISNCATSIWTECGDMVRIYYDHSGENFVYHGMTADMEGDNTMKEPIFLQAAMGKYDKDLDGVYFPSKVVTVTNDNGTTKAFILSPIDWEHNYEIIDSELETTGKILPESAVAVHPTEPLLYYSNANTINSVNIKTGEFKTLFTIEGNMDIKKIALNTYDPETLYIAAENKDEASSMKASLFVYSIGGGSAKQLFAEHKVGGTVRQLIYKGDATEYIK